MTISTLSRAEYDALKRLNLSTLKHIGRSPAHYKHALTHERPDTDALKRGRAVHVATFEPMVFARRYAIWDGGTRRGKDWDKFCEDNAGKEILTESQASDVEEIAAAVRADPIAAPYLSGGRGEQTITWDLEIPALSDFPAQSWECKGRLDWVTRGALVDLKTATTAHPEQFGRQAVKFGYHVQAAWYSDGYEIATGKRLPVVLVVVETEPPHVVSVFQIPDRYLDLGRDVYRGWLNRLDWCQRENLWPGYLEDVGELTLPRWAIPWEEDDDATTFGLEIGGDHA